MAERSLGRANIAPPHPVLAVVRGQDGSRKAVLAGSALAPTWTKLRGGPSLVNSTRAQCSDRMSMQRAVNQQAGEAIESPNATLPHRQNCLLQWVLVLTTSFETIGTGCLR